MVSARLTTYPKTTAATLAFTFTLLALYPEEQNRLFEHIQTVLPNGRAPVSLILDTSYVVLNANADIRGSKQAFICLGVKETSSNFFYSTDRAHSVFYETLRLFPPVSVSKCSPGCF